MVRTIAEAVELVRTGLPARPAMTSFWTGGHGDAEAAGLRRAIRNRDTPALYDWLMAGFSFQGISDRIAAGLHRPSRQRDLGRRSRAALADHRCNCPKLGGFDTYRGLRLSKDRRDLPEPDRPCPIVRCRPSPSARAISTSRPSRSTTSFVIAARATWSASSSASSPRSTQPSLVDPVTAKHDRLMAEFSRIHAVSAKLIAMMLASLLMAGGALAARLAAGSASPWSPSTAWSTTSSIGPASFAAFDQVHLYGPPVYGPRGCAAVIYQLADRIDAREFHPSYPKTLSAPDRGGDLGVLRRDARRHLQRTPHRRPLSLHQDRLPGWIELRATSPTANPIGEVLPRSGNQSLVGLTHVPCPSARAISTAFAASTP